MRAPQALHRAPGRLPPPLPALMARRYARADEIEDLMALLLEHARPGSTSPADEAALAEVAYAVALASLGDQHLWQDLQLPHRGALTALMQQWFPALAAKNIHDMKWKKFLYKQLCDRAELSICRAPTCGECSDYHQCYGPELATPPA